MTLVKILTNRNNHQRQGIAQTYQEIIEKVILCLYSTSKNKFILCQLSKEAINKPTKCHIETRSELLDRLFSSIILHTSTPLGKSLYTNIFRPITVPAEIIDTLTFSFQKILNFLQKLCKWKHILVSTDVLIWFAEEHNKKLE